MNCKTLVFAQRNLKETVRTPISWGFGLILPIGIFIIMQVILKSVGEDAAANVPMFAVRRFTGGACVFGAAFLALFCAMLIANDREQCFLPRLFASPMTAWGYISGYALGVLPVAALQTVITFVAALCFGLAPTPYVLIAALFSLFGSLMFIALGVLLGSVLSAKGAPPVSSVVVQAASLLSGMWFDLDAIGGGFAVFCRVFPFVHYNECIRFALEGNMGAAWLPLAVTALYTAALTAAAVLCFKRLCDGRRG